MFLFCWYRPFSTHNLLSYTAISTSVCYFDRTTSLHSWDNTCISFEPQHTRLDDVYSFGKKGWVCVPGNRWMYKSLLQLRLTIIVSLPPSSCTKSIYDYQIYNNPVPFLGLMLSSIAWMTALSSESTRQSSPMRWPILFAFTLGESIAVGFISSVYAYGTVLKAMMATATATLSVTAYTMLQKNPKYDLSQWGRALSGLGFAFLLYGVIRLLEMFGILPNGFLPYTEAIYCVFGAGLFSLYLAHHTRMIVSGKSTKYQMNEKDYILGAMSVYSDIINIFLYVLRILGDMDDRSGGSSSSSSFKPSEIGS